MKNQSSIENPEAQPIKGFRFSALAAGIKKLGTTRLDLGLITADTPATSAAVTTTNLVFAAPVALTRRRVSKGLLQGVLVNSGNANAYTGPRGLQDAEVLTAAVAKSYGTDPELIVPMSTGVIGNPLPLDRMLPRVPQLVESLDRGAFMDVAHAIMTTDTKPKTVLREAEAGGSRFRMAGMAKGAGMIAPNMATMLSVILADVRVDPGFLKEALTEAVADTFNAATIDGDMSTNDTVIIMAGGHPAAVGLGSDPIAKSVFKSVLRDVCMDLARQIVMDGEGATKVVEVVVKGAPDRGSAVRVARTIAESPLVKTAFHGEDPNWGRIICAAGRAGVAFDPDNADLLIGDVPIVVEGRLVNQDWESAAHKVMLAREFRVSLDLKAGTEEASILTTDMSEEYVSINADYRS